MWTDRHAGRFPHYTQSTAPSNPTSSEFWWDLTVHVLKRYNGTSWEWVGLDDLANVDTSGKADTNILEWDTDADPDVWTPVAKPSGSTPTFRGVRAYRATTAVTATSGTPKVIDLNAETWDTNSLHDNTTNSSRLLLDTVGWWDVRGQVAWFATDVDGRRQARILLNGTLQCYVQQVPDAAKTSAPSIQVSATVRATAVTDYVQLEGFQDSGSNLDIGSGENATWLEATFRGS